jgi:hypothetical protein
MVALRDGFGLQCQDAPMKTIISLLVLLAATAAAAEPLPVPKQGTCPSSYRESGGYCVLTSERAPAAIPKSGVCPSGWASAAHYCVQVRPPR